MLEPVFNACIALLAIGIALALRPWRCIGRAGPPWTWIVAWAATTLLWCLDRYSLVAALPPMSGAALLVLLAGWPLAVLAFLPVAAVALVAGQLDWVEVLHRLVWLGVAPATLALGIGAAVRRWLPNHLFVYVFGRGFLGTLIASTLAGCAALAIGPRVAGEDLFVANVLLGFAEASLTGALMAVLVVFQPKLVATYSDRIYLPGRTGRRTG